MAERALRLATCPFRSSPSGGGAERSEVEGACLPTPFPPPTRLRRPTTPASSNAPCAPWIAAMLSIAHCDSVQTGPRNEWALRLAA